MKEAKVLGSNSDIDTGVVEDVWTQGGTYSFPSAAAATTIVSDSANDTAAGTGARTVRVEGLNDDLREISEDATLDGITPVTLENQFYRINKVQVLTAGSGGANAGLITVLHSPTVIGAIATGDNVSRSAIFTPSNNVRNWAVHSMHGAITDATAGVVTFQLLTRKVGSVWIIADTFTADGNADSLADRETRGFIHLDIGEDVRLTSVCTADNAQIVGGFDLIGSSKPLYQGEVNH